MENFRGQTSNTHFEVGTLCDPSALDVQKILFETQALY